MTPPRRILVTGAAGFLGAAVVRHVASLRDVDLVVGIDRIDPLEPGGEWVRRDVRDGVGDLLERYGIEAVVHHAFLVQPTRDDRAAREVNVDATARLASEAAAAGVGRIVYPSSTTTYGAHPRAGFHTEDGPQRPPPGFAYSEHKVEAEQILRSAARDGGPDVVILRSCVVLGPGADNFITSSLSLPIMPVVAGADPAMQFLHIDDYVTAVEAALSAPHPGTWNVAGSGTVSFRELAHLAGSRVVSVPEPILRRLVDITWRMRLQSRSDASGLVLARYPWLASIERIERDLGWVPRHSSRAAVEAWAATV